ncbi:MAG: HD domain-containing protein, partial [Clostridiales bacterium]|nr:HD domain-containing protein [Clostridiales bacterium]
RGSISLGTDTKFSSDIDIREVIRNAEEEMYRVKTLESKEINSKMLDNIMEALFEKSPREKIHAQNVSKISGNIAKNMGLTETDIRIVKDIGYYHDIDKITLSKKILYNIDNLSSEEQREMETHTLIGYRVLNLFNQTVDMAEVVLSHHERWDGKGYPKKLKGREIPLY